MLRGNKITVMWTSTTGSEGKEEEQFAVLLTYAF